MPHDPVTKQYVLYSGFFHY